MDKLTRSQKRKARWIATKEAREATPEWQAKRDAHDDVA